MNSFQAERGLDLPSTETHQPLQAALNATERGWSVIPLLGGGHPTYGKRPRIRWQPFCYRRACKQQIQTWFEDKPSAYGVVCGGISRLIVLDFDEADVQAQFMQQYPHLLETYLVRSGLRGTLHIYLHVDFEVKSYKLRGGDLKAEGGYVVGAGSEIAGGKWEIVQDKPLYQISESELNQVLADFALPKESLPSNSKLVEGIKSPDDFRNIYRFLVKEYGKRNESLFRVGCLMRDAGYSLQDCIETLANLHATQVAVGKHASETEAQRWAEAGRSLQSVFSKPARPQRAEGLSKEDGSYLPNSLREAILAESDGTAFLRVYEGLLLLGLRAGEWLTEREIKVQLSAYGIGRPSIRKALKFGQIPAPGTPPPADADLSLADSHTKTCVFVPKTKADKSKHRPSKHYCFPSVERLCQLFGVESQGADPIELENIRTVKHYRAALNRELIARRPAKYSQGWLGKRLNVSTKSIQRYVKLSRIKSRYSFHETQIDWGNVNIIPSAYAAKRAGFDVRPYFLQDEQGKRYPAMTTIAQKLLKGGHGVWLMRRDCKHYWIEEEKPVLSLEERFSTQNLERRFSFPVYPEPMLLPVRAASPIEIEPIPELEKQHLRPAVVPMEKQEAAKPFVRKLNYKEPLPLSSDEWLAQKLYKAAGNLQIIEARQMLQLYGRELVGKVLGRMEYLKQRGNIENPAGFMKAALRVAWRAKHGFAESPPKYISPKRR
jgi:hypothetical protein